MPEVVWVIKDTQLKHYIQQQLAPFLRATWYKPVLETPATGISECMRETSVPYFVVLGMFHKRSFAVLVDEAASQMYPIPVIAEKAYFQGGTVFQGELTWEYNVFPRHVFLVHRFFRLAGRTIPPDTSWVSLYALIQSTFDTQGFDICRQPRKWPDRARELAQQGKIVCLATKECLTFQPKRWFALHEQPVMERSYLPALRWVYDKNNFLLCSENLQIGFSNPSKQPFFLMVELRQDNEWLIYARDGHLLVDMTLTGIRNKPLICLPNDILLRQKTWPVIALFRAQEQDDGFDVEVQALCPQRQLPDTLLFLEHVLK